MGQHYVNDAHAISDGKRLFNMYNCSGCHFHGAGGIGPALMDEDWIYGGEIDQIFESIYQGRPNGMPAWKGKLPDEQIWEIAAYVHSLPAEAKGMEIPTKPPASVPASEAKAPAASPIIATGPVSPTPQPTPRKP